MRVALYHRVSTVSQDSRLARSELRAHAERLGASVVLEEEETGSGARNDRPGLHRVLGAARRNEIDAVLVWKLDRFGRSVVDVLTNVTELVDSLNVRFICTSQGIDLKPGGDPIARLMLTMLSAVAEFERGLIRDRTALGLKKARENGVKFGRPPKPIAPLEEIQHCRELGLSVNKTAKRLGMAREAVQRIVDQYERGDDA